ncbi:recF protein [Rubidibacter lacunae KORDI 51-2]|uniref:DNA replication and repair protein RecF n=1 Tax=Rubidibacter lacunae KORDI 51-2 TaxID=582515 RepID=U5DFV4_9CHRO|nr:DNA replication/repair protein RecF [Rubidibacter lacunae]ERN40132.1 recF protein [Rubidibacter lacunae KORDI 51-2]
MYLETLHLRSFRNYTDQRVTFSAQKTILVGNNAQGKSNALEAVELLATLKSHRTSRDRDLVRRDAESGQIRATVARSNGSLELAMTLRGKGRRTLAIEGEVLRRHLDFLGALNAVEFSSLDLDLVRGAPEYRRHWLDALLVQIEPIYAYILQEYVRVVRQRNALLKSIRKSLGDGGDATTVPRSDWDQLALWDAQLAAGGSRVMRRRDRVLQRLIPLAQRWHDRIGGGTEHLSVIYAPNVECDRDDPAGVRAAILEKIKERRLAEQHLGTSVVGPHRDEIDLQIDDTPARAYGSQGQQRTLVLALKLAELELIEAVIGEPPLLLLDDVLAELDPMRQNQLLDAIQDRFQTLITTTHVDTFDAQWLSASQVLVVEAGRISP